MIRRIAVVVPAANEQERIGRCLRAIARARVHVLRSRPEIVEVEVIVVLDGCTDGTSEMVARFGWARTVVTEARCVGVARALGAQRAIAARPTSSRLWIANTDADSEVPRNWLTYMVAAAGAGADLVLGTVVPGAGLPRPVLDRWVAAHDWRRGHPHIHGANLGIRADAYLALGGWRRLPNDEDVDLVSRAVSSGVMRISRTAAIAVTTSARLVGRAPLGFSSYLRRLHDEQPANAAART